MRRISPIRGNFGIPLNFSFRIKSILQKILLWSITRIQNLIKMNWQKLSMTFSQILPKIIKFWNISVKMICNRLFSHSALQALVKYRNHPSLNNIRNSSQSFSSFYCSQVNTNTILKKIRKMSARKAVQDVDIPVKVLKGNAVFFTE